jgi:hypothetical protein
MNITFDDTKECTCYRDLVNNDTDRTTIKNFAKLFGKSIITAVLKTHQKLIAASNAQVYNSMVSVDNRIEKCNGVPKKNYLILKVRIQGAYRKFFFYVETLVPEKSYCISEKRKGQFDKVKDIHVFAINKHDYKSIK